MTTLRDMRVGVRAGGSGFVSLCAQEIISLVKVAGADGSRGKDTLMYTTLMVCVVVLHGGMKALVLYPN